jgi:hypothetical protein
MTRRRLASVCAVLLVALCMLAPGCKSDQLRARTEVLLKIDADSQIRAQADTLTVELASGAPGADALTPAAPETFHLDDPSFQWPASLALIAEANHEGYVFEATITAEANGMALTRGRVRSAFLRGKTLLLSTSLFGVCIGKFDCGPDETCVSAGARPQCVPAHVDETQLSTFVPNAGAGAAGSGADASAPNDAGMTATPDSGSGLVDSSTSSDTGPPREAGLDAAQDGAIDSGPANDGAIDAPSCVPKGAEQCWNGMDDDCNGQTDCADAACKPGASCAPAGSSVGVLVPVATPCPQGFDSGEMTLHQGLTDNGCSGCSCQTTPTQCAPRVYYYSNASLCNLDVTMPFSGGTLLNTIPTYTCSSSPIGSSQGMDTPVAWRVTMGVAVGTCNAGGAATPLPPTWSTSMKLCTTLSSGGGCDAGFVCVPKVSGAKACAQKSAVSCPASAPQETWERSFKDNRSCGNCTCTTSGGDCNNVQVQLGHDWSCGSIDGSLHGGEKSCSISTYAPPAILAGLPTNATCMASALVNGALAATSPLDLCCL